MSASNLVGNLVEATSTRTQDQSSQVFRLDLSRISQNENKKFGLQKSEQGNLNA